MTMLDAFFERKDEVTGALQGLLSIASGLGAKTLHDRIARDLVKKLEEDRFHLVVVGEFNHGKSTFVNALLGETVLATGVTPTTATIHHLKYAEQPEATIVYSSGKRETIPFGTTKKFAVGGGESVDAVDYLEVAYPAPLLKERIVLVDTPGVNDLSLQRADITYSYIPRADAVLFLLDAGQILKESERQFLQEKLLKASRDKIVFVITKWDILSEDEKKEALAYAHKQLGNLVKDPVVFPISAEAALSGKVSESGMPELLKHLTVFLSEERGKILLDNALGEGLGVAELLGKGLEARRRSILMKTEELDKRVLQLQTDLAGQAGTLEQRRLRIRESIVTIKTEAKKNLERFVDETIAKIPDVVDSASHEDLKQYLPAYLEAEFKLWAETQSIEVGDRLRGLAEETIALVQGDAEEAHKRVSDVLGTDAKRLDVQIDTFRYDAGVAGLFALGLGAALFVNVIAGIVLVAAAPVVAVVFRDRIAAEYKKKAKEAAPGVVREAASKVGPKLDEMIEDFATKLESWLVTASEELYREILEVLSATQKSRADGTLDENVARAEIESQGAGLVSVKEKLKRIREGLNPKEKVRIADVSTDATAP